MTTKTVIVTPGRVAYMTTAAKTQFTSKPTTVVWNDYLEELLNVHGDIQEYVRPNAKPMVPPNKMENVQKIKLNTINVAEIENAS